MKIAASLAPLDPAADTTAHPNEEEVRSHSGSIGWATAIPVAADQTLAAWPDVS